MKPALSFRAHRRQVRREAAEEWQRIVFFRRLQHRALALAPVCPYPVDEAQAAAVVERLGSWALPESLRPDPSTQGKP